MIEKQLIEYIYEDMKEAKSDIKDLLAFKNKALGIILASSLFFSGVFSLIIALVVK